MNYRSKLVLLLCGLLFSACSWLNVSPPASPAPRLESTRLATAAPSLGSTRPAPIDTPNLPPTSGRGHIAREHLEFLANSIGARPSGSREEAEAGVYIETVFEQSGYDVQIQPFSFETDDERLNSANIIAVKQGLSAQEIIVGAHYDSGGESDGAGDNASGVAVMLEVAALLQDVATPYTIRFIAFGAEENDLDGSRYYVAHMSRSEIRNTVGMINLDGLIPGDYAYVYGDTGAGELRDWILNHAQQQGLTLESKRAEDLDEEDGTPCECADYHAFQEAGIPFAYFEATNWNVGDRDGWTQVTPRYGDGGQIWHTEYDNLAYIETTFPGRIDAQLHLFVTLLYDTLTVFRASD